MNLFSHSPETTFGIDVKFNFQTIIERRVDGGEKRNVMRPHMLRSIRLAYVLRDRDAQRAREYFETLEDAPVSFPDWTSGAESNSIEAGTEIQLAKHENLDFRVFSVFVVALGDLYGSEHEISAYDPSAGLITLKDEIEQKKGIHLVYPVRRGRLGALPSLSYLNDNILRFNLEFIESIYSRNSAIEWSLTEPLPEYDNRPFFEFYRKNESESWQSNTKYSQKGYGVETSYVKERDSPRKYSVEVAHGERAMSYAVINLFDKVKGRAKGFWFSSERCNYNLKRSAKIGDISISIPDTELLTSADRVGYSHILIRACGGDHLSEIKNINNYGDELELELEDPLTIDAKLSDTAISLVSCVRFGSDELSVTFHGSTTTEAKMTFIELPREYSASQPSRAPIWLYQFSGFLNARYTSHGESVERLGETWTPFDIDHNNRSEKKQSLSSSCNVVMGIDEERHPLKIFQEGYPLEDIEVTIFSATSDELDPPEVWYQSDIKGLSFSEDNTIQAKLGSRFSIAKTEIPTAQIEPRCSLHFGGSACGVTPRAEQYEIAILDELTISLIGFSGDSGFLDGTIRVGDEVRTITLISGNSISIASPFILAESGNNATIKQGCNKSLSSCKGHNNKNRFSGYPFSPSLNPQLEYSQYDTPDTGGGKK